MTTRLEQAIKQLTAEDVRQLEEYAERLAAQRSAVKEHPNHLKLDWAGQWDAPYESGLEAQEALKKEWLKKFEARE